jgi:hypothetical protein
MSITYRRKRDGDEGGGGIWEMGRWRNKPTEGEQADRETGRQ